jgi:flagellar basal body-associated protein FliL
MKKKAGLRILTLVVGLITVAAIVFSQLFYFQDSAQSKQKKQTKTEQQESGKEEAVTSLPSPSLPSSSNVLLQLEVFCLFEISSDDEEASNSSFDIATPVVQLLQTLVGAAISPNAP